MRPHGSPKELERRRRKAVAMLADGYSPKEVAQRTAATVDSVNRWWRTYQREGEAGLASKTGAGRPAKLSAKQKQGLSQRLGKGAKAEGFATDMWTCPRAQQLIYQCYGVHYHVDHVPKLLRELGFSPSKA